MSEPKPFASLSSGLLARKGAARPAMRPQGFSQHSASLDDLGWNDMGHDGEEQPVADDQVVEHPRAYHPTGLTPVTSPVHSQQAELADRFSDEGDEEEAYDEEYDETAEPYEPEGESGGFTGFANAADEDEGEEEEEPEFRVQFKKPGRPLEEYGLTGRPADEMAAPAPTPAPEPAPMAMPVVDEVEEAVEDDVLELGEPLAQEVVFQPMLLEPAMSAPEPAVMPVAATSVPVRAVRSRVAVGGKSKAAFTLRLDPDRHLKLRLACAVDGRSAQQLVTDALDQLLGRMPELNDLADKARRG